MLPPRNDRVGLARFRKPGFLPANVPLFGLDVLDDVQFFTSLCLYFDKFTLVLQKETMADQTNV